MNSQRAGTAKPVVLILAIVASLNGCASPRNQSATTPPRDEHTAPELSRQPVPEPLTPVPTPGPAPNQADGALAEQRPALALRNFLPHVKLDREARVVEFDGTVPIDAHNEVAPVVYLEVLACSRDTREHEAIVVTDAKPSHVHAALLAIGLEPGKPGSYSWQGEQVQATPPTGPRVRVEVIVGEGEGAAITDWAVNVRSGQTLTAALREAGHGLLFAGSVSIDREDRISYLGDGAGTLIGLSTFGTETVACETLFNPDSAVEEPVWIANSALVPAVGTAVRVRITAE